MAIIAEVCVRLGLRDVMDFYALSPATQGLYVEHVGNSMIGAYTSGRPRGAQSPEEAARVWSRVTGGDP